MKRFELEWELQFYGISSLPRNHHALMFLPIFTPNQTIFLEGALTSATSLKGGFIIQIRIMNKS